MKLQFAKIDEKFDETSVSLGRYDERIYNNKKLIEKIVSEHKDAIQVIHDKIRDSKKEAVEEAERKTKIWIFGALGIFITSLIGGVSAILSMLKLN